MKFYDFLNGIPRLTQKFSARKGILTGGGENKWGEEGDGGRGRR